MLHVTSRARNELHGLLLQALSQQPEETGAGVAIRLIAGESGDERSGLALALDVVRSSDDVVECEGRAVLVVDSTTSQRLEDLTLDVVETPQGTQLEVRR